MTPANAANTRLSTRKVAATNAKLGRRAAARRPLRKLMHRTAQKDRGTRRAAHAKRAGRVDSKTEKVKEPVEFVEMDLTVAVRG